MTNTKSTKTQEKTESKMFFTDSAPVQAQTSDGRTLVLRRIVPGRSFEAKGEHVTSPLVDEVCCVRRTAPTLEGFWVDC